MTRLTLARFSAASFLTLLVFTFLARVPVATAAPVPGEVTNLIWCPAQTDCLQWTPVTGATKYRIYRGETASLPCLLNASEESCNAGVILATTTGPVVIELPDPGSSFWYLVTAVNNSGEGTIGNATAAPRQQNLNGVCALSCLAAGSGCGTNGDCCSSSCFNGTCNTACCQPAGALCNQSSECCSGVCLGGLCQTGCSFASDCPGPDTDCQTRTCTAGVCGFSYAPSGTPVNSQTAGDCQLVVCDGAGLTISQTDNSDVPNDGNQCTFDLCLSGVPFNQIAPVDFPCSQGGGVVCDGTGQCVQCNVATQCPGLDTQCQSRICSANTCGFSFQPFGTVCNEMGGNLCNGSGTCIAAPFVVSTNPADAATVLASTSIAVTFSQAMNLVTLTGQTVAGACSGSIQVSSGNFATCVAFSAAAPVMSGGNTIATLTPQPGLLVNTTFKIRVTTAAQSATAIPLAATFTHATGFTTTSPNLCDGSLVISQIYGSGGLTGATYKSDFVELHNRGTISISVAAMSIQYASSSGTTWLKTNLTGSIAPGGYYLVGLVNGTNGISLPAPDATGTTDISGSNGKVALVSNQTVLTGSCPVGGASVIDFAGYGSANCFEGTATAAAAAVTTAQNRVQAGCGDVNQNSSDFAVSTVAPRNSATAANVCACLARNESNTAQEADYCVVQFPMSIVVQTGTLTPTVFGDVFELGVTESAGPNAIVRSQLGFGLPIANPEYQGGWTWSNASYNLQIGNNDEYQASFTAPAPGNYRYAYRFSIDSGVSWTYCDTTQNDGGAGSNAGLKFAFADLAVMTVTP